MDAMVVVVPIWWVVLLMVLTSSAGVAVGALMARSRARVPARRFVRPRWRR